MAKMMSSFHQLQVATIAVLLFVVFPSIVRADPEMLQDICVADLAAVTRVNGFPYKNNSNVTANDFYFGGLENAGNTSNLVGSLVTLANVQTIPGRNTLGVSMGRIDYAVGGINPPHTHPRATEIVFVMEGTLDVGFITTSNVLISKTITKGGVFVFPRSLVHFQKNAGYVPASAESCSSPGGYYAYHGLVRNTDQYFYFQNSNGRSEPFKHDPI